MKAWIKGKRISKENVAMMKEEPLSAVAIQHLNISKEVYRGFIFIMNQVASPVSKDCWHNAGDCSLLLKGELLTSEKELDHL